MDWRRVKDAVRIACYGTPNLMNTIFTVVAVIYVPAFYAQYRGLSLGIIGAALLLARMFDTIIDPAVGTLSDRTPSAWGGRKAWMVASVPIIVITTFLLFTPPKSVGALYLCGVLLAWYIAYSAFTIPYYAWGTEIATAYRERGLLIGTRELFGLVGFCGLEAYIALEGSGARAPVDSILRFAALSVFAVLPAATLLAVLIVPKHGARHVAGAAPAIGHFRSIYEALRDNGPYRRVIAATFLQNFGTNAFGALLVFLIEDVLLFRGYTNEIVALQVVIATVTAPLSIYASNRVGKHVMFAAAALIDAAAFLLLLFTPAGNVTCLFAAAFGIGLAWGITLTVPAAIISDTADYFALKTTRWQPGILLSGYVFSLKLAVALGSSTALWLVAAFGYSAGAPHAPADLLHFKLVALVLPSVLMAAAAYLLFGHPITAHRHNLIRKRLERRKAKPGVLALPPAFELATHELPASP